MAAVSVCIPVYNAEQFLRATLRSVLSQTMGNLEIVITDNASTDGTRQIIDEETRGDPRVRYARHQWNLGLVENYRIAASMATGGYVKWLAGDDVLMPDMIEKCLALFEREPDAVGVTTRMRPIGPKGDGLPFDDSIGAFRSSHGEAYPVLPPPSGLTATDPSVRFGAVVHEIRSSLIAEYVYGLFLGDAFRSVRPHGYYIGAEKVLLSELALRGKLILDLEPLMMRRLHPAHFGAMSPADAAAELRPAARLGNRFSQVRQLWGYISAGFVAPVSMATSAKCALSSSRKAAEVALRRRGSGSR